MKIRSLLISFILLSGQSMAQSPVAHIKEVVQTYLASFESLSRSSLLYSQNNDVAVNELFLSSVQKNPSIQVMARISPDGNILNLVNSSGVTPSAKNISAETWFGQVSKNLQPYTGVSRNSSGRVLLFRAWPLIIKPDHLIGIFSVKIDIQDYLRTTLLDNPMRMEILFRNQPVFSNDWIATPEYQESTIAISETENLTIRYRRLDDTTLQQSAPPRSSSNQKIPPAQPISDTTTNILISKQPLADTVSTMPAAEFPQESVVTEIKPGIKKKVPQSSEPSAPSLPAINLGPKKYDFNWSDNGPTPLQLLLAAIAGAVVILIIAIIIIVRSKSNSPREVAQKTRSMPVLRERVTPLSLVLSPEEETRHQFNDDNPPEELASVEKETRELPAIKELIQEITQSSKKLQNLGAEDERAEELRHKIYEDIHADLTQWVKFELKRLSDRLENLSTCIKQVEKKDGKALEFQVLRAEIKQIMGDIDRVEKNLPQEGDGSQG